MPAPIVGYSKRVPGQALSSCENASPIPKPIQLGTLILKILNLFVKNLQIISLHFGICFCFSAFIYICLYYYFSFNFLNCLKLSYSHLDLLPLTISTQIFEEQRYVLIWLSSSGTLKFIIIQISPVIPNIFYSICFSLSSFFFPSVLSRVFPISFFFPFPTSFILLPPPFSHSLSISVCLFTIQDLV